MPYCESSTYQPQLLFKYGHLSTIYAGILRQISAPPYQREKWTLPDGDFLSVDFIKKNPQKAVVLCHGLEGHSTSTYMNSAAAYFLEKDYSVYAWNNRSCGGGPNRLPKLYHHASTDDLSQIVKRVIKTGYQSIYLLGFSLGGAQILSYFGRHTVPPQVTAGGAVSTPIWLKSSAQKIETGFSKIYSRRFIKKIRKKILGKAERFPNLFDERKVRHIKTFEDLARVFIVPIHGFKDLDDYYTRASPGYSIDRIKTPVLILNALNDPILGRADYPVKFAANNAHITLETPRYGGHCAFLYRRKIHSYADYRMGDFFRMTAPSE